jgi:hypothetical protein
MLRSARRPEWLYAVVCLALAGCGTPDYQFQDKGAAGSEVDSGGLAEDASEEQEPAPTCTDGVKNGQESDIDCGGPSCGKCSANQ